MVLKFAILQRMYGLFFHKQQPVFQFLFSCGIYFPKYSMQRADNFRGYYRFNKLVEILKLIFVLTDPFSISYLGEYSWIETNPPHV